MSILTELTETHEFATLPIVVTRILELLQRDNIDVREMAKVVEADANLTKTVLKVVNSDLYSVRTESTSIQEAILSIGMKRVSNIVLAVSIHSQFMKSSDKNTKQLIKTISRHASCTGVISKYIAFKLKKNYNEFAFIGGFMHDIGKLAMLRYDRDKYRACLDIINNKSVDDCQAEIEIYGVDHLEVGAVLARLWNLPIELENIIAFHNTPEKIAENNELIAVVRFADLLSEMSGAGLNEDLNSINFESESSWQIIKSNADPTLELDLEQITFEMKKGIKASKEFLEIISEA
ncbi:MAG: HDOD domain-containing protein [Chlorobi bacterium]|nr:HDOD domain-containing protein [Chlorobiota bacterium]